MYYRIKQLMLLVGDVLVMYAGLFIALLIRYQGFPLASVTTPLTYYVSGLFGVAVVILFITGLYDIGQSKNSRSLFIKITLSALVWMLLSIIFFYSNPTKDVTPKTTLLLITLCSFSLVAAWRSIYNRYLSTNFLKTNIIFAGLTPETIELMELLTLQPQHGYQVLGCIAPVNSPLHQSALPQAESISKLIKQTNQHPEVIVIAPQLAGNQEVLSDLYQAIFKQVSVITLADFYEQIFGRVPPLTFSESWFVVNLHEQQKKIYDRARIIFDNIIAIIMGLVFIVTFPFVALAIKLSSSGPILFKQTRVGRGEQPFTIFKYRTMQALNASGSAEMNGPQFASVGDARITKVGKFLRQTRIDEIPQFWNILRGEMGLIGPRPERPEFVAQLKKEMPFYALRHLIKPGLTGWAQLHHSYYGTISENLLKLQYDLFYVKNRGLLIDLSITLKTISVLVRFMGR